ncbi:MAG: hypothetical protein ACJ8E3_06195 [Sphingomicrobium sp.]
MDARLALWLERIADVGAAASLAAATGYGALRLGSPPATVVALGAATLLGAWTALRSVSPGPATFPLSSFDAGPILVPAAQDELVLTDSDRLDREANEPADELLLDDVLAKLEDFSRVVRLFDRSAMPTPGELRNRIDRHLDGSRPSAPPDASQALHDALSELRRTLR